MKNIAPDGQIWVCSACGKTAKDRSNFEDVSCYVHAVLCYIAKNPNGSWQAVKKS